MSKRRFQVTCFYEDVGHESVVGNLVRRLFQECGSDVSLTAYSNDGGRPRLLGRLKDFARDYENGTIDNSDLLVIAIDANCQGRAEVSRLIKSRLGAVLSQTAILAVPDPHIERWLLLDGQAFKSAVGAGCDCPDAKCEKDRYKQLLASAVKSAGVEPILGGVEYAQDIVNAMDLGRVSGADRAISHFIQEIRQAMHSLM